MDSADKRNVWLLGIGCATVISLALGIFALSNCRIRIFVENGYTRQTLQGEDYAQWVKINKGFHTLPMEK